MLISIQNLEGLEITDSYSSRDLLEDYYKSLVEDYKRAKPKFNFSIGDYILHNFSLKHQIILEENEHLPQNDFNTLYDDLYAAYELKVYNKLTYAF